MDFKEIQELIKLINKQDIKEISIERKDFKLNIITGSDEPQVVLAPAAAPQVIAAPAPVASAPATPAAATPAAPAASEEAANDNYITIKSPMIGTFYRKPSPDKDVFINVGDSIAEGDVICIVEAMKLFNEIESEVSGKLVKILVDDMSPIEYDQPLFLVDPS
jgi:acetyl-CoA carboxylase biotin carboxyl carrier protein